MRTRAAILDELNKPLTIDEVEIGDPKQGEVLVRMVASGVCHTDVSVMHGILPSPTQKLDSSEARKRQP
jgi:Zn-dependent alcohol dehydrogenase